MWQTLSFALLQTHSTNTQTKAQSRIALTNDKITVAHTLWLMDLFFILIAPKPTCGITWSFTTSIIDWQLPWWFNQLVIHGCLHGNISGQTDSPIGLGKTAHPLQTRVIDRWEGEEEETLGRGSRHKWPVTDLAEKTINETQRQSTMF